MTTEAPPVTVIIPVGPRHKAYVQRALDSVARQSVPTIVIVANDTRDDELYQSIYGSGNITELSVVDVTGVPVDYSGGQRASLGRNLALQHVVTPWVVFLDADDELTDDSLEVMLRVQKEFNACYVYGDTLQLRAKPSGGYVTDLVRSRPYRYELLGVVNIHPVTALVPSGITKILGFDEQMGEWEDWVFYLNLAAHGYCGTKVDHPVFKYYMDDGANRENGFQIQDQLYRRVKKNYMPRIRRAIKENTMCGCNGTNTGGSSMPTNMAQQRNTRALDSALVPLVYKGHNKAAKTFQVGDTVYRAKSGSLLMAHPDHVESLIQRGNGSLFVRAQEAKKSGGTPTTPAKSQEDDTGTLVSVEQSAPARPPASLSARRKPRPDGAPQPSLEATKAEADDDVTDGVDEI